MKYVAMRRDELGEVCRVFEDRSFEFPSYDNSDEAMNEAFYAWKNTIERKLNGEWQTIYGPECYIFLEREYHDYYSHMSLADMEAIANEW